MTPLGLARKLAKFIRSRGYVTELVDHSKRSMKQVVIKVYPDEESRKRDKEQVGRIGQWETYRVGLVAVTVPDSYFAPRGTYISSPSGDLVVEVQDLNGTVQLSNLMKEALR